jgi:hypothetical protein
MDLAELEFDGTLWEAIHRGRTSRLIEYIRSDKPLRPRDRDHLADYLEGKLKRKKGRPPGGKNVLNLRNVAVLVEFYKTKLRESGMRSGIHDLAVDSALEFHVARGQEAPDRQALENYLRRSKRRKK